MFRTARQRENLKMPATAKRIEKTTTVRISRELADKIADRYPTKGSLADMYVAIEPWVKKMAKAGHKQAMAGVAMPKVGDRPRRADATVRILKDQVRRLKSAAPWLGDTVSGLIEDKLWEMLA